VELRVQEAPALQGQQVLLEQPVQQALLEHKVQPAPLGNKVRLELLVLQDNKE
jgi:hypothetical protein